MQRSRSSVSHASEDAYFAIGQFTAWINSADAKAGFLSAALAISVSGIVREGHPRIGHLEQYGVRDWLTVSALLLSMVFSAASAVCLVRAIYPRIQSQPFSRFSWPSVAETPEAALLNMKSGNQRREAWLTAMSLAIIAKKKFHFLRAAFSLWIAGIGFLLLSAFLA